VTCVTPCSVERSGFRDRERSDRRRAAYRGVLFPAAELLTHGVVRSTPVRSVHQPSRLKSAAAVHPFRQAKRVEPGLPLPSFPANTHGPATTRAPPHRNRRSFRSRTRLSACAGLISVTAPEVARVENRTATGHVLRRDFSSSPTQATTSAPGRVRHPPDQVELSVLSSRPP